MLLRGLIPVHVQWRYAIKMKRAIRTISSGEHFWYHDFAFGEQMTLPYYPEEAQWWFALNFMLGRFAVMFGYGSWCWL